MPDPGLDGRNKCTNDPAADIPCAVRLSVIGSWKGCVDRVSELPSYEKP